MWPYLAGELKLSEADFKTMSELYNGEIAFADHCVGRIADRLKKQGLFDDTAIIITSDHGENLGDHGMIDHLLSMYETTLRVPLIIRYPKRLPAGVRVNDLVSLLDVAPTIFDLCHVSRVTARLKPSGASLVRSNRPHRAFVIAENDRPMNGLALMKKRFPDFDTSAIDYRMRAIRTDRYKLIWNIGGETELFDLHADPAEQNNLADSETESRDKLLQILTNWMYQLPAARDVSFMESQDEESLEALRSLGYVE
jgi:arylsulfatase A-like enzyme